jgi:acyl-CoA synthetase (AMP-forming)/AMP-acid ligase II
MTFATVVETFHDSLARRPGATALHLVERSGETLSLTFADLYREASRMAGGFTALGLRRGDPVILALPTSRDLLAAYLAGLYTGVIPLTAPPPRGAEAALQRLAQIAANVGARRVLVPDREEAAAVLGDTAVDPAFFAAIEPAEGLRPVSVADDVAHLQATSGSTGRAKVAVIRHSNLAANVRAIGRASGRRDGDVVVTWLPLYHDMGLIGICCSWDWRSLLVATDSGNFVRNPVNFWLRLVSRFGGTISPAPTSAYQVCARLAKLRRFDGLDLSTWRVGYCGAEPIRERTLAEFQEAFRPYGLPETTVLPVYGLAEATLAVSIPSVDETPHVDRIDADRLTTEGHAAPAGPQSARVLAMVGLGDALAGHQVRVVRDDGTPCVEREIGEVQCAGPSVITEYWRDPDASASPDFRTADGFLRTGDLGYRAGGHLFITGRRKEILILHGRNLLPAQIESLVDQVVESPATNGVAAVGVTDDTTGLESLHLIIESRPAPPPGHLSLEERIREILSQALGIGGAAVHWVEKGWIPKTTSGKIQRYLCRQRIGELAG